jgi:hypothetical protein
MTVKTTKKSIDPRTTNPYNPHSPKTPNPPVNSIPLSPKKSKKPIVDPQLSTPPIDPKGDKLHDSFHRDFPPVPIRRQGANRLKGKSFRRITRSMIGKSNTKRPITSGPIQLSFDHESPHKKLKEDSAGESKPAKETKSEPVMPSLPQKATVTPSSQIPKPSTKCGMPSTSIDKPKLSLIEEFDHSPTV